MRNPIPPSANPAAPAVSPSAPPAATTPAAAVSASAPPETGDFSALLRAEDAAAVTPLVQDKHQRPHQSLDPALAEYRREAATRTAAPKVDPLAAGLIPKRGPHDPLRFCRTGTQPRVVKRLSRCEYPIQDCIDLHGNSVERAQERVHKFLEDALREEYRCVLIVHGKGGHDTKSENADPTASYCEDGVARIKSFTDHWLREKPEVMAFVSAPRSQGGTGADLKHFFNKDGLGAIVNSSRGIIAAYKNEKYADRYSDESYADASRAAVMDMIGDISENALQG